MGPPYMHGGAAKKRLFSTKLTNIYPREPVSSVLLHGESVIQFETSS